MLLGLAAAAGGAEAASPSPHVIVVPTIVAQCGAAALAPRFLLGVPSGRDALFGVTMPADTRTSGHQWVDAALEVANSLRPDGPPLHAFRAGMLRLDAGDTAHLIVVLGWSLPPSPRLTPEALLSRCGELPRDAMVWCALTALRNLTLTSLVEMATVRLAYLAAPSPSLPVSLEVGVVGLSPLAGSTTVRTVPVHFRKRHEACLAAEAEFAHLLRTIDRGDLGYAQFARDCASRVVPVALAEIPPELQAEAALPEPSTLDGAPFRHGAEIPKRERFVRPTPPPPPDPFPQCDEEIFTVEYLAAFDARVQQHLDFHNGRSSRRPKGLYAGLEAVQPHLRSYFAAGGAIDTSLGDGRFRPLDQRPEYPTHWRRDWIRREFADTPDQQVLHLWLDGIDLLDDTPFLMALVGNLYSAYGLDAPSSTASAAAQAASDKVAAELATFYSPSEGKPQLYSVPIELRTTEERCTCSHSNGSRFPCIPFGNDPCGQVPKTDDNIRVIINMSSPEDGALTVAGEQVVSKNVRSGLHPPPGADPATWRHPPEPKPTPGDCAHNDAALASVAQEAGDVVIVVSIDGWKMFHQFFYERMQLAKTGALVPLQAKIGELLSERRLGLSMALVMAMGAGPASRYCQRSLNLLMLATYRAFDRLEQPFLAGLHPAYKRFLAARAHLHDDFGSMARLMHMLVFTDDGRAAAAGVERAERCAYAIYLTFGGAGAAMILADAMKWLCATHSLWCGVRSAPSLGVLWFDNAKRTKRLDAISAALANKITERDYKKLVSYIEYWAQTLHVQRNLVGPLWNPTRSPRTRGETAMVVLISEERGKLKYWRRLMLNCPGTTLARHVRGLGPMPQLVTEHVSHTDCRLDWLDMPSGPVWRCGMGGAFYDRLWQFVVPVEFSDIVTIPLGEFVASIGGLYVADEAAPEARRTVAEIDASASVTALVSGADATRLRVAHEVFLESELFARKKDALGARHAWGDGNETADAASREENERAEKLVRALGHEPRWLAPPPPFFLYFFEVMRRLRALALPSPATHWYQRRVRSKRNDDCAEPGIAIKYMGLPLVRIPSIMRRSPAKHDGAPSPPPKRNALAPSPSRRYGSRPLGGASSPPPSALPPPSAALRHAIPTVRRTLSLVGVGAPPAPLDADAHLAIAPTAATSRLPMVDIPTATEPWMGGAHLAPPPPQCPTPSAPPDESLLPTAPLRARLEHLMSVASNAPAGSSLGGVNLSRLRGVMHSFLGATHLAAPKSTLDNEDSAWRRYWVPYCEELGIDPVLTDMEAMSGRDSDLYSVYCAIVAGCLPWTMERMPAKAGSGRTHALPTSGLKVLGHVRRVHLKRYHLPHFVPLSLAVQVCDGLCKQYIIDHGPDALTPQRKEPLTNDTIVKMLSFFVTGKTIGSRRVDMSDPGWASLAALFATAAQTGFRKAEMSLPAGTPWSKAHISMANVTWLIGGEIVVAPTVEQLRNLTAADYCLIRPPPSKADPLGLHWGACTIYLRFHPTDPINAARYLAWLEIVRVVPLSKRAETPLFVNFSGAVWRHTNLTDMFKETLLAAGTPQEHLRRYSMHSWRIYLACALLASGASSGTIQAMLRWRSDDALRIYARINDAEYADNLARASQAHVSSVRTTTLREEMHRQGLVEGQQHAAFYGAWLRQAANANVTSELANDIPTHSADDLVRDVLGASRQLSALAQQPDDLVDSPLDE